MPTSYLRLAAEQAPNPEGGAATVSATTFDVPVTNVTMDPGLTTLDLSDELRGYAQAPPHRGAAEYSPSIGFDTRAYPGSLSFLLWMACGGTCTTTAGNGVITDPDGATIPAGAYRHVFAWMPGVIPQTFQATLSPPVGLFYRGTGCGIDQLDFAVDGGAWKLSAALKALYWAIISDPSITPSVETPNPFHAGSLTLTWLSNSAVTKEFSFSISNGLETFRQFLTNSKFPDAIELAEDNPYQKVSGSIPKRTMDSDDWNALVNGTTFAAKIKLTHAQSATGAYKHQVWFEMPACQYVGGEIGEVKNSQRHDASFNWEARYDTSTSKWCTVTIVNATSALKSGY